MSILLTEEQELIGQSARDFAKEYLEPIAAELDHTGQFPAEVVKQLAAQDFLGLFLAGEYGGAEAGFISLVEVVENLSRASAAVASILVNHSLAAYAIQRWGTDAQKQEILPALASGATLGGFAVFEHGPTPGVGPDALVATRHAAGWALKGTKAYVRNAGAADVYVVMACTDPAAGAKSQTAFIVSGKAIGLTVGPLAETMGLKGCPVADLVFDDVVVADSALLAGADGQTLVSETLAIGSLMEAAQTVGIGQAAVEHAAAYAKTRVQFGRPISALQAIQTLLAETAADCHLGRLGVRYAAKLLDEGQPFLVEAAMVKQFLARNGSKLLIDTVQVEGGFGYSEFMPLPRLFRDIAGTTLLDAPADYPEKTIAAALLA
jgi:butyryl-CoA dehydrogenase